MSAIMDVRIALQNIEDYASACHQKLVKYPDADRSWLLSRSAHMELLTARLEEACNKAAEGRS